jgi:hypothetical protein
MTSRAAHIRELHARGLSTKEIGDTFVEAGKPRPNRQLIHKSIKNPPNGRPAGRPRTKVHMVDTLRELLAAYSKARSRVTITERMRNALNVLEAQIEEYDRLKDKNDTLSY